MSTILTASWFTPLPDTHLRIGISRGVPRFGQIGKGYRMYRKLQPGPLFSSLSAPGFIERYQTEVLDRLDPQQVVDELHALADGRVPVLVCFEQPNRPPTWCHRSLTASWLSEALGQPVPELGFETLTQDQHPLRPPALLV